MRIRMGRQGGVDIVDVRLTEGFGDKVLSFSILTAQSD